jgi:hypothetical protein
MKSPQQILSCQRIAQQKRLKVLKKLEAVLTNHDLYHGTLTIKRLAKISGVSRPWFYQQHGLKEIFRGRRSTEEVIKLLNFWLVWEKSFLE